MIAIIDYGMGNIHSVQKALELYGVKTFVTDKPQGLGEAEKIVFPGVGAFDDAVTELKGRGLFTVLKEQIRDKKPFLGICLGMQLLFEESQEAKEEKGLGVFKGCVRKFPVSPKLKVPHMGWNQLKARSNCVLLQGIPDGSYVYFCHSYYADPSDKKVIAAGTEYGIDFASLVSSGNVFGAQFHPEKSKGVGLKVLENFVRL